VLILVSPEAGLKIEVCNICGMIQHVLEIIIFIQVSMKGATFKERALRGKAISFFLRVSETSAV
jgi:hypothetical protein